MKKQVVVPLTLAAVLAAGGVATRVAAPNLFASLTAGSCGGGNGFPRNCGGSVTTTTSAGTTTTTTAPVTTTTSNVYTVPASFGGNPISNTCGGGVSNALNAWFATVPDNSTINFATSGCYSLYKTLLLANRNNLIVNGNGSTFDLAPVQGAADTQSLTNWTINGGSNVALENMTLTGTSTATATCSGGSCGTNSTCQPGGSFEFQYGINFMGGTGSSATNVSVTGQCGDFIDFSPYCNGTITPHFGCSSNVWTQPATNIGVSGGTDSIAGRQGMSCIDCNGITVNGVGITFVGQAGFDIEPSADLTYEQNITIENNTFGHISGSMVNQTLFAGNDYGTPGNINVLDNTQVAPQSNLATISVCCSVVTPTPTGYTFQGNTISAFGLQYEVERVNNVQIGGNPGGTGISNTNTYTGGSVSTGYAVEADNVNNIAVQNNTLFGGAPTGFPSSIFHSTSTLTGVTNCGNTIGTGSGSSNITGQPAPC